MTKKAQGLSLTVIILAGLATIVLFILVMIFTGKLNFLFEEEFNPEKHICEGKYIEWNTYRSITGEWTYWGDGEPRMSYSYSEGTGTANNPFKSVACEKGTWRTATECDKDPNAEGCVCDEWEFPNCPKYKELITNEHRTNPTNYGCPTYCSNLPIEINGKRVELDCYSNNPCISAHSPSPCELEDEHYIWDMRVGCTLVEGQGFEGECGFNETDEQFYTKFCRLKTPCELENEHYVLDCEYEDDVVKDGKCVEDVEPRCWSNGETGAGGCAMPSESLIPPFCRPKQLTDYSCQELLYHILRDDYYCLKEDEFRNGYVNNCRWGGRLKTPEIVDIYKEKGCLE